MCGRYALKYNLAEICALFGAQTALTGWDPRYNLGPGMDLPILIKGRLGLAQWGWPTPAPGVKPLINIRSETAATKPSFARSWAQGRQALVPASGFYEWDASGQPYYVQDPNRPVMAFRALWTRNEDNKACFAILTQAASPILAAIHPRMPQMVDAENKPVSTPVPVAVSRDVNDIRHDFATLTEPAAQAAQGNLWVA